LEFNRFDVATKELDWDDPPAWLERFGIGPRGPVDVIDSDVTTLTAAADKVIRVGGRRPYLVNIELQSSHDTDLVRTLWFRQVALDYRHNLPVLTVLVLLRKEADSPSLTGVYQRQVPDGRLTSRYDYQVVRLWQKDVDPYLAAGVGLVPLAPLTKVTKRELPGLVRRIADRINREPRPRADKLWTATYLLMGLRYSDELTVTLLEGIQTMQESTTYQAILRKGRIEGRITEAQRMLLRLGTKRFRQPNPMTAAALEAIQDIDRLEALGERTLDPDIHTWDDLLNEA
jgi:predicted transposase YdaD